MENPENFAEEWHLPRGSDSVGQLYHPFPPPPPRLPRRDPEQTPRDPAPPEKGPQIWGAGGGGCPQDDMSLLGPTVASRRGQALFSLAHGSPGHEHSRV